MVREWMNRQKPSALVFQLALILGSLGFFSLMAVYAFQGSLTRYMADDYCNAVLFSNDAIGGLVLRYMQGWGGEVMRSDPASVEESILIAARIGL